MTHEYIQHLKELGIEPKEYMGQHLLVDEKLLDFVSRQVEPGSNVIEIGSGPGNLTARIAQRANTLIGIEIDRTFELPLQNIQKQYPQVNIAYTDALQFPYTSYIQSAPKKEWQIIGNIPYHISEPLLLKLIDLPIINCVLMTGDNFSRILQIENPNNPSYCKTSMLAETFFEVYELQTVPKEAFFPPPRTESSIVVLTPKEQHAYTNPRLALQRKLFLQRKHNATVRKTIQDALYTTEYSDNNSSKKEQHRKARRKESSDLRYLLRGRKPEEVLSDYHYLRSAKKSKTTITIHDLHLPDALLSKPFNKLDNPDIQRLALALERMFQK